MSNEYKDWLQEQEEQNLSIINDMKTKGFAYLNPEEFFEFLTSMQNLKLHGFYVEKALDRIDTYIITPDKKTKKRWNKE